MGSELLCMSSCCGDGSRVVSERWGECQNGGETGSSTVPLSEIGFSLKIYRKKGMGCTTAMRN